MTEPAATILCTGDLHLGRHPSRIPADLDGRQFSPSAIWHDTVDRAIHQSVDLVVVTGDLIDRENRYFEAFGPLESGFSKLNEATIPTVVVAGNHDSEELPRLMEGLAFEHVDFLGVDGTWDRRSYSLNGDLELTIDGWSFPTQHVVDSPLLDYDLPPADGPTIGIMHADLGAETSEYAPVDPEALLETHHDGWLLGHIHRPGVRRNGDPLILYPGSPQPLDPGEPGTHGPWVLDVTATGLDTPRQLDLATLRYESIDVDVSDAADPKDLPALIRASVESELDTDALNGVDLFLPRIRCTGRTEAHGELLTDRSKLESDLRFTRNGTDVHPERIVIETRPSVDLESLAGGETPVAYLAELLLAIESGALDDYEPLLDSVVSTLRTAHVAPTYRELRTEGVLDEPTREDAIAMLETQSTRLLDALLAQREDAE